MKFAWTDDQGAFRDAARELLAKECPPAVVRAAMDAGRLDRGVWDSLDAMGVLSVLVPEHDGGLGLDECSLVPILEETGRVALSHPIVETALVAAPLGITGCMVATDLGAAAGSLLASGYAPLRPGANARTQNGVVGAFVPWAADGDAVLLVDGEALRLFEIGALELEPVPTVDHSRRAARVAAARSTGELVSDDPTVIGLAFDRGVLGTAAQLVGLARTMLDLAVAHVVDRHQFGVPVGSFQAVKHHLAGAALAIEFAAPAVARAAWSVATGAPTVGRDVSMAKSLAGDAAGVTGRAALQCHGAIGYTVEHDLHLYLKRAWALQRTWGDRTFHADRVAAALGI